MIAPSRYYVYLMSSLPVLHLGAKTPISYEKLFSMCEGLIPEEEIGFLKRLDLLAENTAVVYQPTLKKWHEFEMALRNEIVRIRAGRKRVDPSKYLRIDGYTEPHLYYAALQAYRNPSPVEGEKALDQERWRFLDEISEGHYFDLDILIIYVLKLLILLKWDKVYAANGPALVESVI